MATAGAAHAFPTVAVDEKNQLLLATRAVYDPIALARFLRVNKVATMAGFKDPDFLARQSAASTARKAALERFRANAADPALGERLAAREAASSARAERAATRKAAKDAAAVEAAEQAVHARELAEQAVREKAAAAERERAEVAEREAALEAERKAARDARYAARKARKK